ARSVVLCSRENPFRKFVGHNRKSEFLIYYVTITYRSVLLGGVGVIAVAAVVMYFAFPGATRRLLRSGEYVMNKALAKVGLTNNPMANGPTVEPGPQQAHFTNID